MQHNSLPKASGAQFPASPGNQGSELCPAPHRPQGSNSPPAPRHNRGPCRPVNQQLGNSMPIEKRVETQASGSQMCKNMTPVRWTKPIPLSPLKQKDNHRKKSAPRARTQAGLGKKRGRSLAVVPAAHS